MSSDLELSVSYKTLPTRVGFTIMCALLPVWALMAPILLGLFIGYITQHPENASSWATAIICLGLLSIYIGGVLLTAFTEDDKLFVSKDGIAFPLFLLPLLKLRRNRGWTELRSADIVDSTGDDPRLLLTFSDSSVPISLKSMDRSETEQLLLSVELWGSSCQRSPQLVEYQSNLQNDLRGVSQLSYTQMWEEELGRRFSATSFVPLEPGAQLKGGKLKIVKQLAFGGLSAIYQAQENELDMVVVKESVIPENADPDTRKQAEERIAREAKYLMRLSHPNIARVLDHFVEEGRHYLLLEYVHGQDLRQYVKQNGPQEEETVLDWAGQITSVVEYLHDQDPPIIHRDLTPDNLVLRNDGSVILIDFGAANEFIGQATGTLVGKQAYMPAEQLRGKAVSQSDLYSLGGTVFYLLTGRDPTPLSVSHPKNVLPAISDRLDEIVAGLTAFETEDRTRNAADLKEKLGSLAPSREAP